VVRENPLAPLVVGEELAEGSFGNVYSVADTHYRSADEQEYVYKEYKEYAKPDVDTLEAFTDFYHNLSANDKNYLDSICCWPHELIEDEDNLSGFLMVKIPEKFFCTINFSSGPKTVEAKFEHLLLPNRLLERRRIPLTDKTRYKLLFSAVRGLNFFHGLGICVGDFSHSNLLFSLDECSVFFLDCDSFRLNGGTVFPQTETGNWGVAERYPDEVMGTANSDIYKLGLLALRLLMESDDPAHYQASTNTDRLPTHIDADIKTVIEDSLKEAQNRPTLAEWSAALHTAIANCVSEPAPRRAVTASSAGDAPASEVFKVFPTSTASPPQKVQVQYGAPATPSSPPKAKVQYGESGWKPVEVTRSQYQYKQNPNTNQPAQQSPKQNAQPQKKQGGGALAVTSFVLSCHGWFLFIWLTNATMSEGLLIIRIIIIFFLLAFIFSLIGLKGSKWGFALVGLAFSIMGMTALYGLYLDY
jgi:serine/threonine protein kinase